MSYRTHFDISGSLSPYEICMKYQTQFSGRNKNFQSVVSIILTLLALQSNSDTFANSADRDETARNEPSHQDLHRLSLCY